MPMPEGMIVTPLKSKVFIELKPVRSMETTLDLVQVDLKNHWDHKTRDAEVLAIGPWVRDVEVGDVVVVKGTAGKTIDEGGLDGSGAFRFISQSEILGVYERESAAALEPASQVG